MSEPLPRPHPDVVFQLLGDEAVLVQLKTNRIFALNKTGAHFWQLLVQGHDRGQIESRLLQTFDVKPDDLAREIDALIDALSAERLVTGEP